jgi:hypothetical protein
MPASVAIRRESVVILPKCFRATVASQRGYSGKENGRTRLLWLVDTNVALDARCPRTATSARLYEEGANLSRLRGGIGMIAIALSFYAWDLRACDRSSDGGRPERLQAGCLRKSKRLGRLVSARRAVSSAG